MNISSSSTSSSEYEYSKRLESRVKCLEEKWKITEIIFLNQRELICAKKRIVVLEEKLLASLETFFNLNKDDDGDIDRALSPTVDKEIEQIERDLNLDLSPLSPTPSLTIPNPNPADDVTGSISELTSPCAGSDETRNGETVSYSPVTVGSDKSQDSVQTEEVEQEDGMTETDDDEEAEAEAVNLSSCNILVTSTSSSLEEIIAPIPETESASTQIQPETPDETELEMSEMSSIEQELGNPSVNSGENMHESESPPLRPDNLTTPISNSDPEGELDSNTDDDELDVDNLAPLNLVKDEPENMETMLKLSEFKRNRITVTPCELLLQLPLFRNTTDADNPNPIFFENTEEEFPLPLLPDLGTPTLADLISENQNIEMDNQIALGSEIEIPSSGSCPRRNTKRKRKSRLNPKRRLSKHSRNSTNDQNSSDKTKPPKKKKSQAVAEATLVCHLCGKKFRKMHGLSAHVRAHNNIRPYQCNQCDARFLQKYTLKRHMMIHTGEKRFQCTKCKKMFATNFEMLSHFKRHAKERQNCPICGKGFLDPKYFQTHVKVCQSPSSTKCPICKNVFKDPRHFKKHVSSCKLRNVQLSSSS